MDSGRKTYIVYIIASRMIPPMGMLRGLVICSARSREEAQGIAWAYAWKRWENEIAAFTLDSFAIAQIDSAKIFFMIISLIEEEERASDAPLFHEIIAQINMSQGSAA